MSVVDGLDHCGPLGESSEAVEVASSVRGKFKPGRSGNPRGRPRKKVNTQSAIECALDEQMTIKDAKGTRKISAAEVIAKRLVQKAAAGDVQATKLLLAESPKFLSKVLDPNNVAMRYDGLYGYMAKVAGLPMLSAFRDVLAGWGQLSAEERQQYREPSVNGSR